MRALAMALVATSNHFLRGPMDRPTACAHNAHTIRQETLTARCILTPEPLPPLRQNLSHAATGYNTAGNYFFGKPSRSTNWRLVAGWSLMRFCLAAGGVPYARLGQCSSNGITA